MSNKFLKIFAGFAIFTLLSGDAFSAQNIDSPIKQSGFNVQINADKNFSCAKNENIKYFDNENQLFVINKNIKFLDTNNQILLINELKGSEGNSFGVNANYLFENNFELGIEGSMRNKKLTDKFNSDTSFKNITYAALVNANYNFNLGANVTPYIGLGLGVARVEIDIDSKNVDILMKSNHVAGQFRAGLQLAVGNKVSLTVGYKAFATTSLKGDDVLNDFTDVKGVTGFDGDIKNIDQSIEASIKFNI